MSDDMLFGRQTVEEVRDNMEEGAGEGAGETAARPVLRELGAIVELYHEVRCDCSPRTIQE